MKVHIFSSLQARVLVLIVVAVLPWVSAIGYYLWESRTRAVDEALAEAMQLSRAAAGRQSRAISNAHSLLRVLSALPDVRTGSPEACRKQLADIHGLADNYANIVVTDANGQLLCAAKGSGKTDFSDRDWFTEVMRKPRFVVGRYIVGRILGNSVLPASYPITGSGGVVERVVMTAIDVAWLDQLLHETRLPEGALVSMLDAAGTVLAQQPGGAGSIGKPYHLPGMVRVIPAGNKDGTGEARGTDGVQRLFVYTRLPGESGKGIAGFVAVSIAKDSVLAAADRDFSLNLGLLAVLSLLGLLGTWLVTDRLVLRRMRALIATARRIAAGDFAARTELGHGSSELSELARAFDEMAASLQQFFEQTQRVMEVAPESFVVSDEQGRIVMVNAQTEKLFGYSRDELLGQPIEMLLPERMRTLHTRHRQTYLAGPVVRDMGERRDLSGRRKDGTEFPVDISLGPLRTEKGNLVISAVRDVSERKQFESRILHQATHDALTDLPNRVLFREHVARAMLHATRSEKLIAVLFLDLDGFKNINDTLGHEAGDELLRAVTVRLMGVLRQDDLIGRQGGDEFTILLQGVRIVQDIVQVLEKLLAAVAEPFVLGPNEMHVTASIGVTVFPFDDNEVESLLRNADTAMYQAKEAGKNCFRFYTAEMNAAMRERMDIESGLRRALEQGQFSLHYQPQTSIESGAVVGMEALLRWHHPEHGMISPAKFIPVAEDSGMIVPIGEWVLRAACRQVKAWQAAGLPHLKVSVNLSARQFRQSNLLQMIEQVLQETGLDPQSGMLELELTESMVMRSVEDSVVTLNRLHEMGLQLSIDDFGTGYSSLSYLKRFPINTLKIDQSFVRDITSDPEDAAIAAAIVGLGHSLKLNVIAEGVETREQLEFLRTISCNEAQGYYFSRPLAPDALEKFLREAMDDSIHSPV